MTFYSQPYATAQDGSADWQGGWFDTRAFGLGASLLLQSTWTAVAATNGTLYLEGTNDPAQAAVNVVRYQGLLWIPKSTGVAAAAGNVVGATADSVQLGVRGAPSYVRLAYVRVAGGGAAQFNSWILVN